MARGRSRALFGGRQGARRALGGTRGRARVANAERGFNQSVSRNRSAAAREGIRERSGRRVAGAEFTRGRARFMYVPLTSGANSRLIAVRVRNPSPGGGASRAA